MAIQGSVYLASIIGLGGPRVQLLGGDDVGIIDVQVGESAREDQAVDRLEQSPQLRVRCIVPALMLGGGCGTGGSEVSAQGVGRPEAWVLIGLLRWGDSEFMPHAPFHFGGELGGASVVEKAGCGNGTYTLYG